MANLPRKDIKIFGVNAPAADIRQFGSTREGTPLNSTDPDVLQALANYEEAWNQGIVASLNIPPLEEFNTLQFLATRELAYLQQVGIGEYSTSTTYYANKSITREIDGTKFYQSAIDDNLGLDIAAIAYNAATSYSIDNTAADTNGDIYRSLTDTNIGNPLTDGANWELVWIFLGNLANLVALESIVNPNLVINGQAKVAQEGTSFTAATSPDNSDDTYMFDQFNYLASAADGFDVSQETTFVPDGAETAMKFLCATANVQCAYSQVFEAADCAKILGGKASISFEAAIGGSNVTIGTLRAALVAWDSTKDVVTTDIIATWNGAGTDPDLATNWTYENVPSDLTLTTSYQKFKIEDIDIDTASATNVAIIIWLDDTDGTVADEFYLGNIKVDEGSISTPFVARPIQQEIEACQRFYETSTSPTKPSGNNGSHTVSYNTGVSGSLGNLIIDFKVTKRSAPTVTILGVDGTTVGFWRNQTGGATNVATAAGFIGTSSFKIDVTSNLSSSQTAHGHYTIDSRF